MKRVLFLFVFLSFVGGVAGGADAKRSISGVVKCDDGNSSFAQCAGATVVCEKTSTIGVVADFEGKFGLSCPNDEGILVEFMGMDGVKISAAELDKKSTGLSIELKSSATAIEEVVVKGCTVNKEKGIKSATDIDGKCYPTECISPRWELIGKNKNARCKEQKCNTGWEQGEDGTWSCETIKTEENKKTEEKSQGYSDAEIKELQEKADDAKANEQLLANRMLGGATMAATGAGGQMLATGLAEKKADADAERQMTAYLQTMHCDYADGKQVSGGMKSVMLPGGNELINLYSQYVNLANDLKSRKLALGMRPGIESEPILDGATSGLYDDVSLGKTGGAYVSLARALMNPDGADAVAWAAQKEESQKDIKTGAIVAGVGAAVGLIGNVAINHDAMKGSSGSKGSSRTRKKYQRVTEKVEEIQKEADTAPVEQPCSDITGTTGEGYVPNCKCAEEGYEFSTDKGCYKEAEQAAPVCDKTGLVNSESCTCIANSIETNKVCSCDVANGYKEVEGSCVKEEKPRTVVARLSLSSDTTFKLGSSTLSDKAKTILSELKQAIMEDKALFTEGKYEIVITGHTDRVPFKRGSSMTNQLLSERRALSVKTELLNGMSGILDSSKIKTSGVADTQCDKATYPKNNDERCRKVVITIIAEDEEDVLEVSGELLEQVTSGVADGLGGKVGALDANLLNVK